MNQRGPPLPEGFVGNARRDDADCVADKFLALAELSRWTPLRMHMRRLKADGYLHAVVDMLLPGTARLFRRIEAEAIAVKPKVVLGERFIRSYQDHSFLRWLCHARLLTRRMILVCCAQV